MPRRRLTDITRGVCFLAAVYPGATWEVRTPEQVHMDPAKLDALRDHVGGRGCVVRHGYMVYTWGDQAQRADVASAAKPWYGHFILKAVEDGKVGSLDEPVARFEPRLNALNAALDHKDRRITWRHLANQIACYGVREEPGAAFDYNDWMMALLWDTLFVKVYGATYDNVDDTVLHPLLTDVLQCEDSPTFMAFGTNDRPGRVGVSVRDFARFGLLYLHKGNWNGRQLLREDLATLAVTSPLPNSILRTAGEAAEMIPDQRTIGSQQVPDNQCDHLGSYSFLWWTNGVDRGGKRHWPDAPTDAYGAFGHGGPRAMVVIPSLDVIVSWNDANVESREAENEALRLLSEACLDRDPMLGQVSVDSSDRRWPARKGGRPLFMCGPGDPEGFLYRGALNADGTRSGDQMELVRKLAATGANCIYVQVIRSHGGDGDATQNPFVDHDPAKGLNQKVLDQWETWFAALDEAGVVIYLFVYDDGAGIWDTGDQVGEAERAFITALVRRFQHHRNLIWCVAEEYQERYTPKRVSEIARVIREADDYDHPVAVHKLHGLDFGEFADDPNIDQFAIQYNVKSAEEVHDGLLKAWREADGRYSLNLSECADMGSGAKLREKLWASAMAGASVMVLGMDIATTPPEDLYACGRVVRRMEAADFASMSPHDEYALRSTRYVFADPGRSYLAYSPAAGEMGLSEMRPGTYSLTWLDCATGETVDWPSVLVRAGEQVWPKPEGLGPEIALHVRRID
jgi:hypothetical protein